MNTKHMIAILLFTTSTSSLTMAVDHQAEGHAAAKHTLTLEGARRVGQAAEAFARSNGATPSIAVVDEAGTLLYFVRLDGNFPAAANVSIGKARTSATFRKPTKEFEDIVNQGRFTMTALPDFTPLQGGVPILVGGEVIGAVGVSGARNAAQDEAVAKVGAAVFEPADKASGAK